MHRACSQLAYTLVTFKEILEWGEKKHLHVLGCTCLHKKKGPLEKRSYLKDQTRELTLFALCFLLPDGAKPHKQ